MPPLNGQREAILHTVLNGQELELRLPTVADPKEFTPMMKLLAAVMMRAEEELGWWETQVAWLDEQVGQLKPLIRRQQIRLVAGTEVKPQPPEQGISNPSAPPDPAHISLSDLDLLSNFAVHIDFERDAVAAAIVRKYASTHTVADMVAKGIALGVFERESAKR